MVVFPKLLLLWTAFFMLSIALPAVFAPKAFIRVLDSTLKNSDVVRTWAFITMLIWFLYLSVYRKFDQGLMMIFSIFGWLSLLKWLFLLRFPLWGHAKYKLLYSTVTWSVIIGICIVLFSVFMAGLTYFL